MPLIRISTLPPLPPRPMDAHKGTFGRVLILGGNDAMLGAPVFSGTSALRMGSGLVQIAVPQSILAAALSITPELIGLALKPTAGKMTDLLAAANSATALVIGPGLGKSPASKTRLMRLIRLDKPIVLDADALNMLSAEKLWPKNFNAHAVLTPHPGEMKRLAKLIGRSEVPTDDAGRIDIATTAANTFNQVIVLKGHRTIVTDGTRVYLNHTGDSTLSKAGTGDILSGMIGSLLAQKMSPFDSACCAVHLHGRAGEFAGTKFGMRSALAREIIDQLPSAIAAHEREFG